MSLHNVKIWKPDEGMVPVTLEEALELFPEGASGSSGLFRCGVCFERVTLASGPFKRYFRHTDPEKDVDCPERMHTPPHESGGNSRLKVSKLPLCMRLTCAGMEFGVVFSPLPEALLRINPPVSVDISGIDWDGTKKSILRRPVTPDAFPPETPVYIKVGNTPMRGYRLKYTGSREAAEELKERWGISVQCGNCAGGIVFDAKTGKRRPEGADVKAGRPYYLLIYKNGPAADGNADIGLYKIPLKDPDWMLYRVFAKRLSENAGLFFMKYGLNLVSIPARLEPVWPPYVRQRDCLLFESGELVFSQRGKGKAVTFPDQDIHRWGQGADRQENFLSLRCDKVQQLLCLGRDEIIDTVYLRQADEDDGRAAPMPEVSVQDRNGRRITQPTQSVLPDGRRLRIAPPPYDGRVDILKDGRPARRLPLTASQALIIDDIDFGTEIGVYQGLDRVRSIRFELPENASEARLKDERYISLLKNARGRAVPIPHAWGNLADYLLPYPLTRSFLIRAAGRGCAPSGALTILKDIASEVKSVGRISYDFALSRR